MPRMTMTAAERTAINEVRRYYPGNWKQRIRDAWMNGEYGIFDRPTLQNLRNREGFGPAGLEKVTAADVAGF